MIMQPPLAAERILQQISLDHTYQYVSLDSTHVEETIQMFTHAFCDYEPMTQYVEMEYAAFSVFARTLTEKAAQEGLSIVALDSEKIIACALVEDLMKPATLPSHLTPKFAPIFSLLEQISAPFFAHKKIEPHQIAHLTITAVAGHYQGQGLSTQINFRAMAQACLAGFQLMVSELTNFRNEEGILHHLQYDKQLIGSQIYQDFIFANHHPFQHLAGSAESYLWELIPGTLATIK